MTNILSNSVPWQKKQTLGSRNAHSNSRLWRNVFTSLEEAGFACNKTLSRGVCWNIVLAESFLTPANHSQQSCFHNGKLYVIWSSNNCCKKWHQSHFATGTSLHSRTVSNEVSKAEVSYEQDCTISRIWPTVQLFKPLNNSVQLSAAFIPFNLCVYSLICLIFYTLLDNYVLLGSDAKSKSLYVGK